MFLNIPVVALLDESNGNSKSIAHVATCLAYIIIALTANFYITFVM